MDAIQTGSTEFDGVAPGHYELTQGDPPRVVALDANVSQQVESGAGVPAYAVSGTLQTEAGAAFTGDAVVSAGAGGQRAGVQAAGVRVQPRRLQLCGGCGGQMEGAC